MESPAKSKVAVSPPPISVTLLAKEDPDFEILHHEPDFIVLLKT